MENCKFNIDALKESIELSIRFISILEKDNSKQEQLQYQKQLLQKDLKEYYTKKDQELT